MNLVVTLGSVGRVGLRAFNELEVLIRLIRSLARDQSFSVTMVVKPRSLTWPDMGIQLFNF